ncbi:MAG: hypothetical protein OQL11_01635 [Gammaproteobacteria bacterium]|nr:hypothetical protein [Gammaproteobacteria bacterium]
MSRKLIAAGLCITSLLVAIASHAQGPELHFSADAVQMAPDRQLRNARMYVGDQRVRMEYERNSQRVAEIVDWARGRAVLLLLDQGTYMEQQVPAAAVPPQSADNDTNPCRGAQELQCHQLGQETLFGRRVDKWEMVAMQDGQLQRSLHWIDPVRQMPLRQFLPDGTVSELKPLGAEIIDGRRVEKWEQSTTRPDGTQQSAVQWYDPQLKIAIREELPGGFYRELKNIRVARQAPELFEIPAGFRRMEIPAQTPAQTQPKRH